MKYRPEIDGLRALAVVPVVLFHAGFVGFSGGYVGVDVFFVISGFLITSIIIEDSKTGGFSLRHFYERRVRRIFPALFTVMLVSLLFAWLWLIPNEMRRFCESLISVATFSSNVLFFLTSGYFDGGGEIKPMLHTWSLAIEEQYYFIFPLYFVFMARLGWRWLLHSLMVLAVASFLTALVLSKSNPAANFLLLPSRFWELLMGSILALLATREGKPLHALFSKQLVEGLSLLGLLLIGCAVVTLTSKTPYPGVATLLPIVGAGLVIAFASDDTLAGRFLGSTWMVRIGLISYSLYLWHQPMFAFARQRSIDEPSHAVFAAMIAGAVPLSYLTYRFVETPFRRKNIVGTRMVWAASFAGIAFFIAFGMAGRLTEGFPHRMPVELDRVHISRLHEKLYKNAGCLLHANGFSSAECIEGDRKVVPRYALVGDSHAQALNHELSKAFAARHLSYLPFAKSGCRLDLHMPPSNGSDEAKSCVAYQNEVRKVLAQRDIHTVIVFSRWDPLDSTEIETNSKAIFDDHLKSIRELLDAGKNVILVYPVPAYKIHISDYMTKNLLFYDNKLEMVSEDYGTFQRRVGYYVRAYDAIAQPVRQPAGWASLQRIHSDRLLCDTDVKGRCVTQHDGIPLYCDESHVSNEGAKMLAAEIMKAIP